MAFDLDNFDKLSAEGLPQVRKLFSYISTADALATISASAYFNDIADKLTIGDDILLNGSDGFDRVRISAVSPNVTVVTDPDVAPGSITNTEVAANAAIAFSKLAVLASGNILVGSAGGVATSVAMSGDATIVASGALTIANSAITNAKVAAAAAIDFSKLAALPSAQILVGSAGNVPTAVAMSGDVAISNTGATTIQAGAIDLAMLSAGITPSHVVKFAGQPTTVGGAAAEAFAVAGVLVTDLAFVQIVDNGTGNVTVLQAVCTADTLTVTFSADPQNDTVFNYQILRAAA